MKRTVLTLVVAVALAGCGNDVYERANTTDTQYIHDENACLTYAEKQPPAAIGYVQGGTSLNTEKERKDERSCMKARGYTLEPKWPFGPYGRSATIGTNPAEMPLATPRE